MNLNAWNERMPNCASGKDVREKVLLVDKLNADRYFYVED